MDKFVRGFLTRQISWNVRKNSTFTIAGKIAIITGGGSGIGLCFAKELLKKGLKGATLADIDPNKGQQALKEIERDFGENKAIFVKTDVTKQCDMKVAFERTVTRYKNLDIVINNAGVLNDKIWEKAIAININGTVYGCLLAWDYLPKYRSDDEGVIVNLSSVAGLFTITSIPLYAATKHAIIGLTRGIGVPHHYNRTKIRVVAICPGVTDTNMISSFNRDYCLSYWQHAFEDEIPKMPKQKPEAVAKALIQSITEGTNGSYWVVMDSKIHIIPRLPEVLQLPK